MKIVDMSKKFFTYDESNKPAITVKPGETVEVFCEDCFQNQLTDESIMKSELLSRGIIINPSTGPIYVDGAMPGDTLAVHIDNIKISGGYGRMAFYEPDLGVLAKFFDKEESVRVPIVDGVAEFFDGRLKLPIRPMVGVMAVTPKGRKFSTMSGDRCGGNMDCKHLGIGSTLYLPVEVPGALLGMGDIHALQGDGEVPAALEVSGSITVTINVIKGRQEKWPVLETDDAWYVIATRDTINEACPDAMEGIAEFLIKRGGGYSKLEWMILLGMAGDLEVCQIPNPRMTARYRMPKSIAKNITF